MQSTPHTVIRRLVEDPPVREVGASFLLGRLKGPAAPIEPQCPGEVIGRSPFYQVRDTERVPAVAEDDIGVLCFQLSEEKGDHHVLGFALHLNIPNPYGPDTFAGPSNGSPLFRNHLKH